MKIGIVGTGYVGLVSGACFSEMGTDVTCVDIDKAKIENLQKGKIPIFEPGLEDLVMRNIQQNRLHFITDISEIINQIDILFIAVGTPPDEDGNADLKYVFEVAHSVGKCMDRYLLVVNKSTVPVGTAKEVKNIIIKEQEKRHLQIPFDVASNPEFLKEGAAIKDFMSPDRVIVGVESDKAKDLMSKLYRPFLLNNFRVIYMDISSAEMTKYAANAMLATRVSFMNEMANLCERVGADINQVRKGISTDARIGSKFLYAGCGYGGSCFPKDIRALINTATKNDYMPSLLVSVNEINEYQKTVLFQKLQKHFGGDLSKKKIAVWGLSFKPNTDDMREAPSLVLIKNLVECGAQVSVFDPIVKCLNDADLNAKIYFAKDNYDAAKGADAVCLITEWQEFRIPSWDVIRSIMRGNLLLDGRNIYDKKEVEDLGFIYEGIVV